MKYPAFIAVFLALCLGVLTACSSSPDLTVKALSYDDIKGSGLANRCPQLTTTNMDSIAVGVGDAYQLREFCLEPETFYVQRVPQAQNSAGRSASRRVASEFVESKLLTRESSTLDQISGELRADGDGTLTFVERGGFDFQPVTLQLPDGERVPLLFTVKGLVASTEGLTGQLSPATRLAGEFDVPPYRTSSFIDPKGRGLKVGYDAAVGIPIQADREAFAKQNTKSFEVKRGRIVLQVDRVENASGEIAGHFESEQPSDSEFGAKASLRVKVQGKFYGRLEQVIALGT